MQRCQLKRLHTVTFAIVTFAAIAVAVAPAASAHPLGNFTVNYYSGITVEPHAVEVNLVVDRAEIPTLQVFPKAAAGRLPAGADAWRTSQCTDLAGEAVLQVAGSRVPLVVASSQITILAGAAGLATSRLECTLRTSGGLDVLGQSLDYRAATTSGRVGWHEVTARGNGTMLAGSDVPQASISQQLTSYPADLLTSPLDQRTARFEVQAGSGLVAAETPAGALLSGPLRGLDRVTNAYTSLVSATTLTPAFAVLAIVLSMLLGGLHAFAPGHGKTLMAAYLVGREGTWRQAAVIGVSITVTHTIGVLLLGVALSGAALAAPEQVYPWLGLLSGILLAGIGVSLLRSARSGHRTHAHTPGGHWHGPVPPGRTGAHQHQHEHQDEHEHTLVREREHAFAHSHVPEHDHDHDHEGDHAREHDHDRENRHQHGSSAGHSHGHLDGQVTATAQRSPRRRTWRLAAVGLAGGLVPSPSALLVLLGGIALGRAWFGALLVLFYGIGMSAALVGTGLMLVLTRDRLQRWSTLNPDRHPRTGQVVALRLTRALPILSAVAVTGVGLWIAISSLMTI